MSEWDDLKVVTEIPERNYVSKIKNDEEGPITVLAHMKADGFTMEKFRAYWEDPSSMKAFYEGRVDVTVLGGETTETTSKAFLTHCKMPLMVSNRSMILLGYTAKEEGPNGWHYEFSSSLGTESLIKKHKDKIGSDVVS